MFRLEPYMHRSRSNWTHKCTPCNNRSLPNFIQIGQHLREWHPKNLLSAYIRGGHGWGMADKYSTVSFKLMRLTVAALWVFAAKPRVTLWP